MRRGLLAGIVAGSVLAALAACGQSSTSTPKATGDKAAAAQPAASPATVDQLTALLLGTGDLPAGYTTKSTTVFNDPAPQDNDCSWFYTGYSFVLSAGAAPAAAATLVVAPDTASVSGWRGAETLFSYPGGKAHDVMEAIRKTVAKCPTGKDMSGDPTKFALAPGTGTGDESLTVTARTSKNEGIRVSDTDVTIVRRGTILILVEEHVSLTGSSEQLMSVAKLADTKVAHAATSG